MTNALVNIHRLLALIHEARGDPAAALIAERAAATAEQEHLDARRRDLLAVLEVEYATAERERTLAEQALTLQREQTRLRTAAAGIGLGIFALVALLFGYRAKTRHARELATANTQLAALNAEKSALMDIASHDLRGHLATIRWQAEGRIHIADDSLEPKIKEDFTNIATTAGAMHHKVSRLLDSQRAESLQPLGPPKSLDLAVWLRDQARTHAAAARAKSIDLDVQTPDTLPLPIRREELAIVVDNLIDNALKYSPPGATVHANLTTAADGGAVLNIIDHGPGIPLEEQPRMFEKFQRLSPQPTGGEDSTGLGLAIVKRLCDRLGITIQVVSAPGKGTRFELGLPG